MLPRIPGDATPARGATAWPAGTRRGWHGAPGRAAAPRWRGGWSRGPTGGTGRVSGRDRCRAGAGPRGPGANANISSTALVTDRGWSLDEYEAWIGDTLYHQLMSPEAVW